mmetsp:Transcript_18398/g.42237  ORF Transcript_18398/g.42237 Transcript_18398/m.42237 type:complete len:204 (-) Transcript_18398:71-682(-)|eukprot:CAMPEP_0172397756 /NCGR_PEP_ID=MMETSP1061-20121228/32711_1 /TAXON_ID=37318 /ORGANISM="Pseudo-nitzschia pungens, Strain cf. pungens" /LENGTH=203 /DNA_ID=CAMNT_0013130035 /DNA_START=110 /DNA_END=721 /DNA_ORIENTATION=-
MVSRYQLFVLSQITVLFFLSFKLEAHVVVDDSRSIKPGNSNYVSRRAFISAGVCSASLLALSTQTAADSNSPPQSNASGDDKPICLPPKVQLEKLSDTRAQIDMAVQASSVQAFQSAAELTSDPLLDESSLSELLGSVACEKNPSLSKRLGENGAFSEILESIANMKKTLNGGSNSKLTTEDAMAVMRYGTNARSNLDTIFSL